MIVNVRGFTNPVCCRAWRIKPLQVIHLAFTILFCKISKGLRYIYDSFNISSTWQKAMVHDDMSNPPFHLTLWKITAIFVCSSSKGEPPALRVSRFARIRIKFFFYMRPCQHNYLKLIRTFCLHIRPSWCEVCSGRLPNTIGIWYH